MKKILYAALVGVVLCISPYAWTAKDDTWALSDKGSQRADDIIQVDGDDNQVRPGVDNRYSLGSSSLRWSDVQTYDITVADDLTVTDDSTFTDDVGINGVLSFPVDAFTVGAATETTPTATYITLQSTGSALTLTGVVLTSGTVQGEICIVESSTDSITISDEDVDNGSNVQLKARTRKLDKKDIIVFIWNGTDWVEVAYVCHDAATVTAMGSFTEAQLKVSTPTAVGQLYYDSTNKAVLVSTGTSNDSDYGQVNAGGTAPAGW